MPTMRLSPASTEDYRLLAEKRLPRRLFDIIDGGSYYETTLRANSDDFHRLKLRQRVLRDVSDIDTSTTLFGHRWSMPVALAPTGMGGMMARRGEVMAKKAADAMGVPMCLSAMSICSMEEVAAVSDIPFWFQLYMMRDRDIVDQILRRAENLGIRTLVFTVDLAVVGARYRDVRNGIHDLRFWPQFRGGFLSYATHPGWAWSVGINGKPHTFGNIAEFAPEAKTPGEFGAWVQQQFDPSVTWKDMNGCVRAGKATWSSREFWMPRTRVPHAMPARMRLSYRTMAADNSTAFHRLLRSCRRLSRPWRPAPWF